MSLLGAVVVLSLVYVFVVRSWFLRWGASSAETRMALPGDELLPAANSGCTRAIDIAAPAERVWPWLAQIGQAKGGFYSYTYLENLVGGQIVNADRIHPEWQDVKVGDGVRLHPAMPPMPVTVVELSRALVLGGKGLPSHGIPPTSWAFILQAQGAAKTRLFVRWRSQGPESFTDRLLDKYLLEPIHFIMERRMMIGIKQRAEKTI